MTKPAIKTIIETHKNAETLLNLNTSLKPRFVFLKPTNKTIPNEIILVKAVETPITSETSDNLNIIWITPIKIPSPS